MRIIFTSFGSYIPFALIVTNYLYKSTLKSQFNLEMTITFQYDTSALAPSRIDPYEGRI